MTVFKWQWVPEFLESVHNMIEEIHEPLYHYTGNREAAKSIGEHGCLWLTRADCFLDDSEVHYGIDILLTAVAEIGGKPGLDLHRAIDDDIRAALRNAFVLSLTDQPDNAFHKEHYGRNIVKFEPNFQMTLNAAGFNVKEGLNCQVVYEIYRTLKGKVIYDPKHQHDLARRVTKAIVDFSGMTFSEAMDRDLHRVQLREMLLTAVVLMKAPSYEPEAEYRICLVREPNNPDEPVYDQERRGSGKLEGKQIVYTQVFLPPANGCMSVTYDE